MSHGFKGTDSSKHDELSARLFADAAAAKIVRNSDIDKHSEMWAALDVCKPSGKCSTSAINVVLATMASCRREKKPFDIELACALLAISKKCKTYECAMRIRGEMALIAAPRQPLVAETVEAARNIIRKRIIEYKLAPKRDVAKVDVYISTTADRASSLNSTVESIINQFGKYVTRVIIVPTKTKLDFKQLRNSLKCKFGETVILSPMSDDIAPSPLTSILAFLADSQANSDAVFIVDDCVTLSPETIECLIDTFESSGREKIAAIKQIERHEFDLLRTVVIPRHVYGVLYPAAKMRKCVTPEKVKVFLDAISKLGIGTSYDYAVANLTLSCGFESVLANNVFFSDAVLLIHDTAPNSKLNLESLAETKKCLKSHNLLHEKLNA